jgi:hypothetical protein
MLAATSPSARPALSDYTQAKLARLARREAKEQAGARQRANGTEGVDASAGPEPVGGTSKAAWSGATRPGDLRFAVGKWSKPEIAACETRLLEALDALGMTTESEQFVEALSRKVTEEEDHGNLLLVGSRAQRNQLGHKFWSDLAEAVNETLVTAGRAPRKPIAIYDWVHARYLGARGGRGGAWSDEDVALLLQLRGAGKRWRDIAEELGRYTQDVRCKWRDVTTASKKGAWSREEEKRLKKLVRKALKRRAKALGIDLQSVGSTSGNVDASGLVASHEHLYEHLPWESIARRLGGRSYKQCRQKWRTTLSPAITRRQHASRLAQDLELVRALHNTGAEDESEVSWGGLVAYLDSGEARRRLLMLSRRIGFDNIQDDRLGEVVDRLLPILESAQSAAG